MVAHGSILLLCGFGTSFILMSLLWFIAIKIKNYAVVDVGWGISIFLYCLIYFYPVTNWQSHQGWILICVGAWALRLSTHLLFDRIIGREEDGRYQQIKKAFKKNIKFKFFLFFQAQALFNAILSLPFLIVALSGDKQIIDWVDLVAIIISLMAVMGETFADDQLKIFKKNPQNKGKVCNVGLWAYSRHPNYFFEFMVWVGFSIFSLRVPWGWLGLVSPILILSTLLKVTGIPATEEQSLRTKGDLYRDYQMRVSKFIPWIPKKMKG